jgi:hypothetical protein
VGVADKQVVEVLGRNRLVDELLRAGLEVAFPARDRGIDLIVYADKGQGVQSFVVKPIQMKAASVRSFGIDRKYAAFPNLILAYVWYVGEADKTLTCALTYPDAVSIAKRMGYTKSRSWGKGRYDRTEVGGRLLKMIEEHRMAAARWRALVMGTPER